MLALYLLAAHMAGDFLFQNRWHSARKFTNKIERGWHVLWYSVAFIPVAAFYADRVWKGVAFVLLLAAAHFATDTRRYLSTIGDVLGWRMRHEFETEQQRAREWVRSTNGTLPAGTVYDKTPPNPWPAMPLMIDQSWQIVQLAVLAGLFLT
jgi:hypothetical protein